MQTVITDAVLIPVGAPSASRSVCQEHPWFLSKICGPAVSFLAVEDAIDLQVVAFIAKEDAVFLRPEPDHGRRDAFELFGGAFAEENVATQCLENLQGDWLLDSANVGLGLPGSDDTLRHGFRVRDSSSPSRPWKGRIRRAPVHGESDRCA
jgi:hypothetical protein